MTWLRIEGDAVVVESETYIRDQPVAYEQVKGVIDEIRRRGEPVHARIHVEGLRIARVDIIGVVRIIWELHKVHGARDVSPSRGVYEFLNTLLRCRGPHDVERIALSRDVTQRGTVLDPLGLVGDLVVRDAARPVAFVEEIALLGSHLGPLGLGFGLDFCGVFDEGDRTILGAGCYAGEDVEGHEALEVALGPLRPPVRVVHQGHFECIWVDAGEGGTHLPFREVF